MIEKIVGIVFIIAGLIIIVMGLGAEVIGIGDQYGVGWVQFMVAGLGVVAVIAGWDIFRHAPE